MRRPSGVIFDLGDTVIHCESRDFLAGNRRLLEFAEDSRGVTPEEVQAVADEVFRWITKAQEESAVEFTSESIQKMIFDTLDITFRVSYRELESEFWNAAYTYVPVDGIYGVLDMLDAGNIKAGILSNTIYSRDVLEEELAKHDLLRRFSFVVASADHGMRKPHPAIFRIAAGKMGLDPADIWFAGDSLEYDIRGALRAGMYPVWYNNRGKTASIEGEYLEVKDWDEFQEKLAQCT